MLAVMVVSVPRSDEVLAVEPLTRRVELRLQHSGYPELQNVEVVQGHGRILLRGEVRTYFLKQLAQTLILPLPEVTAVENQVNVNSQLDAG